MIRIITDFDGPIMDVSDRYYTVYQFCLDQIKYPEQTVKQLSKDDFWQLKRSRVPEKEIGLISGLDSQQAQNFARLRRQTVHTLPYLKYDKIQPDALATLKKIQNMKADLLVMTMRRRQELAEAFSRYDLQGFFPENRRYCLTDDYIKTTDVEDKPLLMQRAIQELNSATDTWMIGDTEADIVAAKTHNIKVIAVLCGIRDRLQLQSYQPDYIVNNLAEAIDLITAVIPAMT